MNLGDILQRNPIVPDYALMAKAVEGKRVLVTGAGGSIGSELCRQIVQLNPNSLVMVDNSELALYNISREINNAIPALGDVSNLDDVRRLFTFRKDVIFHAAAYKHVTVCEQNPEVAERVNVLGTSLVALEAWQSSAKFILVSTDKAVRPISWMGKTKARAEVLTRNKGGTVIRLGNVAGSSGSVIPLFAECIRDGVALPITNARATRYFLYPEEAAQFIIQAAALEPGTYVPEMGLPVEIKEIARRMGAYRFKVTGLRPGEKLHEELFVGAQIETECSTIYRDGMVESRQPPTVEFMMGL